MNKNEFIILTIITRPVCKINIKKKKEKGLQKIKTRKIF